MERSGISLTSVFGAREMASSFLRAHGHHSGNEAISIEKVLVYLVEYTELMQRRVDSMARFVEDQQRCIVSPPMIVKR